MSSTEHGADTLETEVTNVSNNGIWLLSGGKEYFLAYDDFPWFKEAAIGQVLKVEEPSPGHFHWPEPDVDLGLESIQHPDKYPLAAG
ncbi:MAG: DUF2442 domain-containing protein [Gammaproteobacteria bacterium]|nr:DUF2442 domain-containing protein [Gammaproteobacteria bacterium]